MNRIAIDYTPACEQGGGIGRYVRELVSALAAADEKTDFRLFTAGASQNSLPAVPGANFTWRATSLSNKWLARLWYRAHIPAYVTWFTGEVDLFHATDFVLPPVPTKTKTLVTVHDLSFVRTPETATPQLKAYLDLVVPRSVKRATHVLADSEATKRDLIDVYQLSEEKITVLLSGVDERFVPIQGNIRPKYNIPDRPYLLSVGTVQPRKNYGRVIQALANLRTQQYEVDLVIAGGRGWLESPIYETIQTTNMADYVHFIGFVDDTDLPALYTQAACVVFPSLYEGFGFPVLEGMACGTPVVTSNISSLPEVTGDAALMVDPYNLDAITEAIRRILDDTELVQLLVQRGFEQVKRFTWERSAQQLKQIYEKVIDL